MQIKQDPVTKLWAREDGAVLMPPAGHFKTFRWTFGSKQPSGYLHVGYRGKYYKVHQIICRAFNGLCPPGKPEVDHINRIKDDNRPSNLRWASRKENTDNRDFVDKAVEAYGVRACDDPKGYSRAWYVDHREDYKARYEARKARCIRA